MVMQGDRVRHDGAEKIAVDVTPDGWVVMRDEADLEGLDLTAASVDDVEVVGHVESVPGWVEDAPGSWRRA